jgi:hypothetical protein
MAITTPSGFKITSTEPVDSRQTVADQTSRYTISPFNAYNGMIVYQQDTQVLWVLIDITNIGNSNGWSQVGGGGTVFSSQIGTSASSSLFTVNPSTYRTIYVNYYLQYNASNLDKPSRTGQIQVTIPFQYTTEQVYYTEQTTEVNPPTPYKSQFSINTEQAIISFSYSGSSGLINAVLNNTNPDYTVDIKGEYKTIAKI